MIGKTGWTGESGIVEEVSGVEKNESRSGEERKSRLYCNQRNELVASGFILRCSTW